MSVDEYRRNNHVINCPKCGWCWGQWGYGCRCGFTTNRKLHCTLGCQGGSKPLGWCIHDRPEGNYDKNGSLCII